MVSSTDQGFDWESRFWSNVVDGPLANMIPERGPCMLWVGRVGSDGYPRFYRDGTTTTGARAAWEIASGQYLDGFSIRHTACDRQLCVNPEHHRPWVAAESVGNERLLMAWNARHDHCVEGHAFTPANAIIVAGGRSCRACRHDVERVRRSRRP